MSYRPRPHWVVSSGFWTLLFLADAAILSIWAALATLLVGLGCVGAALLLRRRLVAVHGAPDAPVIQAPSGGFLSGPSGAALPGPAGADLTGPPGGELPGADLPGADLPGAELPASEPPAGEAGSGA